MFHIITFQLMVLPNEVTFNTSLQIQIIDSFHKGPKVA